MVPVARHASPSAATWVLTELAWDSRCTGRTSPFYDSYREELNCNRLKSCFPEESLSFCKRGSDGARSRVSALSSQEVHGQASAGNAPAARSSSRAFFEVAARADTSGGGGVGLLPSPFPVAPLPHRQLGLGHWSPVPPLTGTDSHLVPLSIRVPSIPLPSVSLSWTKQCALRTGTHAATLAGTGPRGRGGAPAAAQGSFLEAQRRNPTICSPPPVPSWIGKVEVSVSESTEDF